MVHRAPYPRAGPGRVLHALCTAALAVIVAALAALASLVAGLAILYMLLALWVVR